MLHIRTGLLRRDFPKKDYSHLPTDLPQGTPVYQVATSEKPFSNEGILVATEKTGNYLLEFTAKSIEWTN